MNRRILILLILISLLVSLYWFGARSIPVNQGNNIKPNKKKKKTKKIIESDESTHSFDKLLKNEISDKSNSEESQDQEKPDNFSSGSDKDSQFSLSDKSLESNASFKL